MSEMILALMLRVSLTRTTTFDPSRSTCSRPSLKARMRSNLLQSFRMTQKPRMKMQRIWKTEETMNLLDSSWGRTRA